MNAARSAVRRSSAERPCSRSRRGNRSDEVYYCRSLSGRSSPASECWSLDMIRSWLARGGKVHGR